jgi:predicted transcriptional regulator
MTSAFTLRLSDATLQALDQLAEQTERSRSWLAVRAIEDYIALNAWQIDKIEAGIAAADRGEAGRAYLLAEEQCFYDKDEHRWVCIDYRCCCGIC